MVKIKRPAGMIRKASGQYKRVKRQVGSSIASALQFAQDFSNTKTQMKENTSSGEGLTSSTLTHASTYILRSNLFPKSVKGKCCFASFTTGRNLDSTAGDGLGAVICTEGSVYQAMINGGTAQNYGGLPYFNPVAYNALMTDTTLTGSSLFPTISSVPNQKMFNKTLGLEIHMANFATADAVIHLYIFESKCDASQNPEEVINDLLLRNSGGLAGSGQPAAGVNTGGAIGSYNDDNVVGDPTAIPGFNTYYRTLKKMRFDLSAGSTHEQEYMIKMNLMHDQSRYITMNTAMTNASATWIPLNVFEMKYPKGMIHVWAHQRGCVVNDVTGGANTPTFASTKIGYIIKKNLTFNTVEIKETRSDPQLRYSQLPFGATDANQKFVNVADTGANLGKV